MEADGVGGEKEYIKSLSGEYGWWQDNIEVNCRRTRRRMRRNLGTVEAADRHRRRLGMEETQGRQEMAKKIQRL